MTAAFATALIACLMSGPPPAEPGATASRTPELRAKAWFNNPVYRLHDDRQVILFFFKTDSKQSASWAGRLNRIARRPDVVVIGLTEDNKAEAQRFIKRRNVRFTVGAGSRAAKSFGIRRLPALRVLDRKDRGKAREVESVEAIARTLPEWRRDISELDDETALMEFIASDAAGGARKAAIKKLYETLPSERRGELLAFVESQLPLEPDPYVRSRLRIYRDLALGERETVWEQSASNTYWRGFRANPHDPAWAEAHTFKKEKLELLPPRTLLREYRAHASDNPNDVLIRRMIVETIGDRGTSADQNDPYRTGARAALMEILVEEPDHSIRLAATSSLGTMCQFGDLEVADLLDSLALTEPNDRTVRPTMEYTAYRLRTGIVEIRFFEPPE